MGEIKFPDLLQDYVSGKCKSCWNSIVITASDENQAQGFYEELIKRFGDPPLSNRCPIRIISDSAKYKMGNGGSTLKVLSTLYEELGEALYDQRILVLHSAGYSQRLPTAMIWGKIFTTLSTQMGNLTMLDIKLAQTAPLSAHLPPGIFVSCTDEIQPWVPQSGEIHFGPHFTAIAHPTTDLELASKHGVYVVDSAMDRECRRVLQKAPEGVLKACAITPVDGSECCLIDSMFFFTHRPVSRRLLAWAAENPALLDQEVDAYGDFLRALGTHRTSDYIAGTADAKLRRLRQSLFDLLGDYTLEICFLRQSYFVHLGTNREYLEHLTRDPRLMADLGLQDSPQIVCSHFEQTPQLTPACVVEFCFFSCPLQVGNNCILSNCHVDGVQEDGGMVVVVPDDRVIQTVPVDHPAFPQQHLYTTFVFGTDDDLKAQSTLLDASREKLVYLGRPLDVFLRTEGLTPADLFTPDTSSSYTMWTAKLFSLADNPTASFLGALEGPHRKTRRMAVDALGQILLSMQDILRYKSTERMLQMRDRLARSAKA